MSLAKVIGPDIEELIREDPSQLPAALATAELRPTDALPSVRQPAGRLRINPATVVQPYRSLEADGFVEIRQGAGTYVRTMEG